MARRMAAMALLAGVGLCAACGSASGPGLGHRRQASYVLHGHQQPVRFSTEQTTAYLASLTVHNDGGSTDRTFCAGSLLLTPEGGMAADVRDLPVRGELGLWTNDAGGAQTITENGFPLTQGAWTATLAVPCSAHLSWEFTLTATAAVARSGR